MGLDVLPTMIGTSSGKVEESSPKALGLRQQMGVRSDEVSMAYFDSIL